MTSTFYVIRFGTSRGAETYGYTTCTFREAFEGGKRLASCSGGGYDLAGTVLGAFIQRTYQSRLRCISSQASYTWAGPGSVGMISKPRTASSLYGMTHYTHNGEIHLDGGCGWESMVKIGKAVGLAISRRSTGRDGYSVEVADSWDVGGRQHRAYQEARGAAVCL